MSNKEPSNDLWVPEGTKFEEYQKNTFEVYTWYTCRMIHHLHKPRLPDYDRCANVVVGEVRKYQSSSNEKRFPDLSLIHI